MNDPYLLFPAVRFSFLSRASYTLHLEKQKCLVSHKGIGKLILNPSNPHCPCPASKKIDGSMHHACVVELIRAPIFTHPDTYMLHYMHACCHVVMLSCWCLHLRFILYMMVWCNVMGHVTLNGVDFGDSFLCFLSFHRYSKEAKGKVVMLFKSQSNTCLYGCILISRIVVNKLIFFSLLIHSL